MPCSTATTPSAVKRANGTIILSLITGTVTDGDKTAAISLTPVTVQQPITFNPKLSLTAEVMFSHIRSQQPGGLTDAQIKDNAQQSLRSRNWFDIKWTTPALILNYQLNEKHKMEYQTVCHYWRQKQCRLSTSHYMLKTASIPPP